MTLTNVSSNGSTAIGDDGLGQQPWWVEQWMELINGYRFKKRLERAWGYAREGNVTSIRFEGRRVHARPHARTVHVISKMTVRRLNPSMKF